ncbi:MAG: TIGR00341 family protein [Bacteroidales bacterium]|nr:TIGR00341 family protein [Bacteroidales bacterium]
MGLFKDIGTLFKATVNIAGYIDTEAAEKAIRSSIYFRGPNAWILAIATIIASIGLNVNSIPVVIGAMLISPLMGPIFGLGLGLGVNDMTLLKSSGKNLLVMVCISLAASFLYFLITPLSLSNPTELLARTNPTIYDVLIALFGGFAGILEQCRKEKGTVFSGVAIATALMPPLCTAGFGLASGNLGYFLGALYLFFINCLFIMLATYISVKYFRFRQTEYDDQATGRRTKRISSILIILFIVPSIWSAVTLIRQNNFEENAIAFVEQSKTNCRSIIYDYRIDHTEGSVIELFFTGDPLDEKTKETIRKTAEEYGIKENQLIINDHTYSNDTNDIELVKGIYDKMDEEIAKRDEEIRRLKEELRTSKGVDIPYSQIVREMKNNYPSIEEVHITHGAGVTADSLQLNESMIVLVTSSARLSEEDSTRLNDWLKIRLDSDSAKLILTN